MRPRVPRSKENKIVCRIGVITLPPTLVRLGHIYYPKGYPLGEKSILNCCLSTSNKSKKSDPTVTACRR